MDDAEGERRNGESVHIRERRSRQGRAEAPRPSAGSGVEHAESNRWNQRRTESGGRGIISRRSAVRGVGNADESRPQGRGITGNGAHERVAGSAGLGFWDAAEFIPCLDGKSRRVEPGTPPLVDGFPGRVGQLRAYGNAISPQVAAGFVKAYLMGRYHGICENTL